jgi:hypothetical protein
VDDRSEVRDFLVTRRARITLSDVGLPDDGTQRRVPGLRRREVADGRMDVLAANLLGRAVYAQVFEDPVASVGSPRSAETDQASSGAS